MAVAKTVADLPEKGREAVEKAIYSYPEKFRGGVCAFQLIDKETGKERGGSPCGSVCHANLSYKDDVSSFVIVNGHKAAWASSHPEFMLWVARETPLSHGVLNKDNEEEVLHHALAIDGEATGRDGALWLCKAMRHLAEDVWKPKTWELLRAEGLDGLQAFIGADILNNHGQPYRGCTHTGLFGYCNADALRLMYDNFRSTTRIDKEGAAQGGFALQKGKPNKDWGSMKGKMVKKPDGWGGFAEVLEPGDVKSYAAMLKEIFEGDPKNVG